jgi:lipoprotein-releasing system permease protein
MIGIALGVAVLITVLSVMNGFDDTIRDHFFAMAQQVTIRTVSGTMQNWQPLQREVSSYQNVIGTAPFVAGQGLLSANGQTSAVLAFGIDPAIEQSISELPQKIISGNLNALKANHFGVVIGAKLASTLGLALGDKVNLVVPTVALTPVGIFPRFKAFTVVGIFQVGNGFGYDSQLAYINIADAQKLFLLNNAVSGLQLKLSDLYAAPAVSQALNQKLPAGFLVSDWTQDYGAFFQAVKLEKTMMFLILILLVAVAAFNLVSTLVMTVTDKKSDIAILRTLGATPGTILRIFMIQGMVVGVIGTLIGIISGILLALHVTEIVNGLESLLHVQLLSSDVYYVDYLPSHLQFTDVWQVSVVALILCLLATIYPAWRAARTQPAEALRYE